jgi:hypothetical protein
MFHSRYLLGVKELLNHTPNASGDSTKLTYQISYSCVYASPRSPSTNPRVVSDEVKKAKLYPNLKIIRSNTAPHVG